MSSIIFMLICSSTTTYTRFLHVHIELVSVGTCLYPYLYSRRFNRNTTGILVYDHLITFADEVSYMWARPKHLSSMLFLMNRYLGCLSNIWQVIISLMALPPDVSFLSDLVWNLCHFRAFTCFVCRGANDVLQLDCP